MGERTLGPWIVDDTGLTVWGRPYGPRSKSRVADAVAGLYEERKANAHLIAAAPDLLKTSIFAQRLMCGFICFSRLGEPTRHAYQCLDMQTAIAKAKGE